ncbi:hypothetical protein ACX80W_08955 [Arthrobacter sp. TMN-37]
MAERAIALAILLQVAVPAVALFGDLPTRFGFQMYSAQGGVVVEALDDDGKPVEVDLSRILPGALRAELDWTKVLPEEICAAEPHAARVTVTQSGRERTLRCA